ncbi:MAG: hypothetical protein N5P05_003146 [Chroococcopsis gigantea SAG 12.99]|jgi:hypothetical protein|nr:glycosyltransferase [Chlorogloea purpurea SAG 13.99]MDV3001540.1 hypothetical protein [Chroococcopsis gigantea SAG 12.99]
MKKLYFLLPGTTRKYGGGGLWAELKTVELADQLCPCKIVTYRQPETDHAFLPELLRKGGLEASIFVLSWGFDVPKLVKRLEGYNLLYHAHSSGYGFSLPPSVPIIAVSRNTMGYWGEKSPNAPIYYLPNRIGDEFRYHGGQRDIDVLVQARKSSSYLLRQLVPALSSRCRVQLLDGFVEDLAGLFNRSKIYLYDSAEYWRVSGLTEGFGLPPLEALACGCRVFSSVNHALADYLDPPINCEKIGVYSCQYDVERILNAIENFSGPSVDERFLEIYRPPSLLPRLEKILLDINDFFDMRHKYTGNIKGLDDWRVRRLWVERSISKIKNKLMIGQ